jgi:CheY-like chemotaxis protein
MEDALIIDDHAGFRAIGRAILESAGYAVSEAATGGAGLEAAERLAPELVLLDIGLPDLDGFEVAERLARLAGPPAVILTSSRDRADYGSLIESAAHVRGFVPKAELSEAAIRRLVEAVPGRDLRFAGGI